MATLKVGICEPKDFSLKAMEMLKESFEVSLFEGEDFEEFITDKDILFVRLGRRFDDEVIRKCNRLKILCSPTTGLNHIQTSRNDVKILSLKGESDFLKTIRATPEHVFGLTLALIRNYSHAFLNNRNAIFNRDLYKGFELYNNKVGIIGMGRVGKILAQYYKAFDATVLYYDVLEIDQCECVRCNSIGEVIQKSNIIILETNYTDDNYKMISKEYLEMMKDKFFINAARGELVDEESLIHYIKIDWFAGVALDVLDNENACETHLRELLDCCSDHNLIITPHIGGATYSSMARTEEFLSSKLLEVVKAEVNDTDEL